MVLIQWTKPASGPGQKDEQSREPRSTSRQTCENPLCHFQHIRERHYSHSESANLFYTYMSRLIARWSIHLPRHDEWSPFRSSKSFCGFLGNGICSDHAANRHEKPECCSRSHHVLSEGSSNPVWTCAISHDVDRTKYETNYDSDSATHHSTHLPLVKGRWPAHISPHWYWHI